MRSQDILKYLKEYTPSFNHIPNFYKKRWAMARITPGTPPSESFTPSITDIMEQGAFYMPDVSGTALWTQTLSNCTLTFYSYSQRFITTADAAATGTSYVTARGLNSGELTMLRVDWDKDMLIRFFVSRATSNANAQSYVQLKQANTIGDLAALGLGVAIDNFVIKLENYNGARAETSSGITMTSTYPYWLDILHTAGVSDKLYVNGTLTCTDTTRDPSGNASADSYIVFAHRNNGTGTACEFEVGAFQIWRKPV